MKSIHTGFMKMTFPIYLTDAQFNLSFLMNYDEFSFIHLDINQQ